ncbi:MAG: type I secretion system permease/ATPase [Hyphomicrobium sp.]|nr:type I secretion system permease/ATPase [Hyphomicrobium sp.]
MARRKDKKEEQDKERLTAAMRRLEDLLQNPGPGITVKPAGKRFHRDGDPVEEFEADLAADVGTQAAPVPSRDIPETRADTEEAIEDDDAPQTASSDELPAESVWAKRLGRGPDTPPKRAPKKVEPKIELPKGMRSGIKKPASSSGGLFGVFLSWLLGPRESEVKAAVSASRRALNATFLFSAVINILMMAGPLFMLQVYDRVLSSGSFPTLVTLSIITAGLYGIIGMLELARSRIVSRIGAEIDQRLSDRVFEAALRKSLATQGAAGSALRELDSFRQFISGPAPITFFDTPWTPVYLFVIFLAHWMLGVTAVIGTVILLTLAWLSEQRGRLPLLHANHAVGKSLDMAETGQRNAEAITAMGMLGAYRARWQSLNGEGLGWQLLASDRLGGLSAFTKATRLLLQSLMLAIAAGLAIKGEISPGAIIAATIIFGRALAPVEQIIGHWRGFIKARESFFKLEDVLAFAPHERSRTEFPRPRGVLEVQNIRVAAPETRNVILNGISFKVSPGQMLAIIGPSASGKSTLVRAIVGLWPTFGGAIMLDSARLDHWHPEDLGKHFGYLPQSVELFAGTVKENICRFRDDATDEQVIEAAKQAHAHELILALPNGYETELGNYATYLSGGQRQRIALARALFSKPPLVVLDEPNSNLDRLGDEALSAAIDGMRERGQTIILVSHRVQAIGKADLLLLLDKGQQRAFGPRNEVMKLFQSQQPARRATDRLDDGDAPAAAAQGSGLSSNDGTAAPGPAKSRTTGGSAA